MSYRSLLICGRPSILLLQITALALTVNRVPYLDPSFEALVKIQLRFCAEAYSRMAQVQQYVIISESLTFPSRPLGSTQPLTLY